MGVRVSDSYGWRRLPARVHAVGIVAALTLALWGTGLVHLPRLEAVASGIGATLGAYTYAVVGVMALLETGAGIGLVAPGELAVVIGGVTAGQGHTDLIALIVIVWTSALAGDLISYALGRRMGRTFLLKPGHLVRLTPERLLQTERFLARHGGKTIVVGRFIGLVRAMVPFVAGSSRLPARRFIPATFVAAGLWSAALSVLGYVCWQSFDRAAEIAKQGSLALIAVVLTTAAVIIAWRAMRGRNGVRHPYSRSEDSASIASAARPGRSAERIGSWEPAPDRGPSGAPRGKFAGAPPSVAQRPTGHLRALELLGVENRPTDPFDQLRGGMV